MTPISLKHALTVIDQWLKSDDVYVTDGEGGPKLPNAWIDCVKGSLLNRLCVVSSTATPEQPLREHAIEFCHWCQHLGMWYDDEYDLWNKDDMGDEEYIKQYKEAGLPEDHFRFSNADLYDLWPRKALSASPVPVQGDYWKHRCKLAENVIEDNSQYDAYKRFLAGSPIPDIPIRTDAVAVLPKAAPQPPGDQLMEAKLLNCLKIIKHKTEHGLWEGESDVVKYIDETIAALSKYCTPYGKANPETYAYIDGYTARMLVEPPSGQGKGLEWVKASERLPENIGEKYFVKTPRGPKQPIKGFTLAIHKVNADCFRRAVKSTAMHHKCRVSNKQPNKEDPEMIDITVVAGGGTGEQNRYLFEIGKHYAMEVMSKKNL